jgi:hypothetical protein
MVVKPLTDQLLNGGTVNVFEVTVYPSPNPDVVSPIIDQVLTSVNDNERSPPELVTELLVVDADQAGYPFIVPK